MNPYLVITNKYPAPGDLYQNAFVHRRLKLYEEYGVDCDVFVLRPFSGPLQESTFDGIAVHRGGIQAYRRFLSKSDYSKFLIHFPAPWMISGIDLYHPDTPLTIWQHGFEVEAWHRRLFNLSLSTLPVFIPRAVRTVTQVRFLRSLYKRSYERDNMKFVFISHWIRDIVAREDVGLLPANSDVIHNVIDPHLYSYSPKKSRQRMRILSIRPYTDRTYANDLAVKAVLSLKTDDLFKDLEFLFVGSGKTFNTTLAPVQDFPNVTTLNRFLPQEKIALLHKEYGVFLCPTRWDSQGVSRGEAMSSGLVPITSRVAAIPEFVDKSSGILADPENFEQLADAIRTLYHNPELFHHLSRGAAERVREQCGPEQTITKEIELIRA